MFLRDVQDTEHLGIRIRVEEVKIESQGEILHGPEHDELDPHVHVGKMVVVFGREAKMHHSGLGIC